MRMTCCTRGRRCCIEAAATERVLAVSVMTVAELPTGARLGYHDEPTVRRFFAQALSQRILLDELAAERAAEPRAAHQALKMPDALMMAPADLSADGVITGDRQWLEASGLACELRLITSGALRRACKRHGDPTERCAARGQRRRSW